MTTKPHDDATSQPGEVRSSDGLGLGPERAEDREQWILPVKRYAHDGGGLVVRCPHCKEVIGLDGEEGDDIRGEQFQHRSKRCDGWFEVWTQARRVAEV